MKYKTSVNNSCIRLDLDKYLKKSPSRYSMKRSLNIYSEVLGQTQWKVANYQVFDQKITIKKSGINKTIYVYTKKLYNNRTKYKTGGPCRSTGGV